jgi:hypothetical protein
MIETIQQTQMIKIDKDRSVFVAGYHPNMTWLAVAFAGGSVGVPLNAHQTRELIEMLSATLDQNDE